MSGRFGPNLASRRRPLDPAYVVVLRVASSGADHGSEASGEPGAMSGFVTILLNKFRELR